MVLPDGATRRENSAEHCWSLALIGVLLHAEMAGPVDLGRALTMVAIHDLVEIEAGDTFAYDAAGRASQAAREEAAAEIVFGVLPTISAAVCAPVGRVRGWRDARGALRHGCDRRRASCRMC